MTTASHGHDAAHGAGHDFDGEPARELGPDEPRTPAWLPAIGLALFLCGGVAALTLGDDAEDAAAQAAASASAAVAAAPSPRPPPQPAPQAPQAQPAQALPAGVANITPQQRAELQKRIDAMKAQRAPGAPGAPPPAPHP